MLESFNVVVSFTFKINRLNLMIKFSQMNFRMLANTISLSQVTNCEVLPYLGNSPKIIVSRIALVYVHHWKVNDRKHNEQNEKGFHRLKVKESSLTQVLGSNIDPFVCLVIIT